MSQIYKPLTSAGPIPPIIATSYVTQDGTAVPAANVLIVNGFESVENNNNGIITKGGVVGTGTVNEVDVVLTNRTSVSNSTVNAVTVTNNLLAMTNGTAVSFRVLVTGFDSANNVMAGGELLGIARATGGVATVVGTNDTFDETDAALNATDWDVITDGALTLQMQFVGVAAHTVAWRALFEYIELP